MTKIEDSCGCVWCDMGIEPSKAQDGTPWHDTKQGSFVCEGPEGKEATKRFRAAMVDLKDGNAAAREVFTEEKYPTDPRIVAARR